MTKQNAFKTLALAAALAVAGSAQAAELSTPADLGYEVGMSGAVSFTGRFPTQAMEDQFNAYLAWVEQSGIEATYAFAGEIQPVPSLEPGLNGKVSETGRFPTQAMENQFNAYLTWVEKEQLASDYAFRLIGVN